MPVNESYWQKWPVAPRETTFSADDAVVRLQQHANGSAKAFNQGFLFRIDGADPKNPASYRLPLADVVDGKLTLIPRAVFSAGVIMSGGHGGLYDVLNDTERDEIRSVLTRIYDFLAEEYSDPRVVAPWLRGNTQEERDEIRRELNASIRTSWDLPIAADDHAWNATEALKRIREWSGGRQDDYIQAFLWADPKARNLKGSYRLPIADVVDGQLVIVPRAVNALAASLSGARTGIEIPLGHLDDVQTVVKSIQDRINGMEAAVTSALIDDLNEEEDAAYRESLVAGGAVFPPSEVFQYKQGRVTGPEPFTVTADGSEARGHLWLWNKCHAGIGDRCVVAPRSATNYAYFHNGQMLTADGQMVKVGKITMDTGHAGTGIGAGPAAAHYDNTGTIAAAVRITEDRWGGYANGVPVSTLTDEQVQRLRMSPISGDWRRVAGGSLELVAALAVNTPGFPIVASLEGSEEIECIQAAGVLMPDGSVVAAVQEEPEESEEAKRLDGLDVRIAALYDKRRADVYDRMIQAMKERGK